MRDAAHEEAYMRGLRDGRITGFDSMLVVSPYDVDLEASLYEAWQDGVDDALEVRSEIIVAGL